MTAPYLVTVQSAGDERAHPDESLFELTLFISGASDLSAHAIANARRLCAQLPGSSYHLSVVDVNDNPADAFSIGVRATPTLVRRHPLPMKRHVGDLSDTETVLLALELPRPAGVNTKSG